MSVDGYVDFVNSGLGKTLAKNLGLPQPIRLERYHPGQPLVNGTVLIGSAKDGYAIGKITEILRFAQVNTTALTAKSTGFAQSGDRFKAIVFDATGIKNSSELKQVYEFFNPVAKSFAESGRLIIIGCQPECCADVRSATAQRALEGFVRAMGKEIKNGVTSNLIYCAPDAVGNLESTFRFFVSPKSAYVSGQVVRITACADLKSVDWTQPLLGKNVLVTGASRGIGRSIAETLARDGAKVFCLDIPAMEADLKTVANQISGVSVVLDITAPDAPTQLVQLAQAHNGFDVVVHNAGVTRDKTLAKMDSQMWDTVMDINLSSEERINDELIAANAINPNGRIICVSSISGIAGNMGQSNYAMSKAGVIGMVNSMAPLVKNGITINAVAPGFIETAMTAAIPLAIREAGRRMNSMSQGGLPVDVAEAIAWFANPASNGVNGNVVRVCGQSLIGA